MTGVPIRRGKCYMKTETHRGRDQSDVAASQGRPRTANDGRSPPDAKKQQGRILVRVSEGAWPC